MMLVRHAQSEWNLHFSKTRVDPGIPDPSLTDLGRQQAQGLALQIARVGVTRLIASPYRRALETTMIVSHALGLPVSIEPLVRERCFFSCDIGSDPAVLAQLCPAVDFTGLGPGWWGEPPETEGALLDRCNQFRAKIAGWSDLDQVAVISHWGFIRAFTGEAIENAQSVRYLQQSGSFDAGHDRHGELLPLAPHDE